MHTPVLDTERLILRPLTMDDADAAFVWMGDPRVNGFMAYPLHKDISITKEWLSSIDNSSDTAYCFGFVRKADSALIGSGGIYGNPDTGVWHFGYNIRYEDWHKGYATEATKRIIQFAYQELHARDFEAEHADANPASGKVIEKCGLHFSHYGEYKKSDGSAVFKSKHYVMHLD